MQIFVKTYNYGSTEFTKQDGTENTAQLNSFNRQKDLLMLAFAFVGTVTGYYFGRVPAELNAQQAQNNAKEAQKNLTETQTELKKQTEGIALARLERDQSDTEKKRIQKEAKSMALRIKEDMDAAENEVDTIPNDMLNQHEKLLLKSEKAIIDSFLERLEN